MAGLAQIRPGTLLDIAGAVEDRVLRAGSVLLRITPGGVGRNLHEEPSVFNFEPMPSQCDFAAWDDPGGGTHP